MSEWHNDNILNEIGKVSWKDSVLKLHENNIKEITDKYYRRLAYDEILSNLLVLSQARKRIKKFKKKNKVFDNTISDIL